MRYNICNRPIAKTPVRRFKVPTLNSNATYYIDLLNWKDCEVTVTLFHQFYWTCLKNNSKVLLPTGHCPPIVKFEAGFHVIHRVLKDVLNQLQKQLQLSVEQRTETVLLELDCVHENFCQHSNRKRTMERNRRKRNAECYLSSIKKTINKNFVNYRVIHLICFNSFILLTPRSTIIITNTLNIVGSDKLLPTIRHANVTIKPVINYVLIALFQAITYNLDSNVYRQKDD